MDTKTTYFAGGVVCAVIVGAFVYAIATWGKEPVTPNPVRRKSPTAIANIVHQPTDTYIKVVYGQPYKRGRDIFGGLVEFNEIWRTGANEATELLTTNDILFAGKKLDAGIYALFTIPRKDEPWTIILNSKLGQWGAFRYDSEYDVLRVKVPAVHVQTVTEAFTIYFSGLPTQPTEVPVYQKDSTNLVLAWDHTKVKIPIVFLGKDKN